MQVAPLLTTGRFTEGVDPAALPACTGSVQYNDFASVCVTSGG
jgi:hypothetical protein